MTIFSPGRGILCYLHETVLHTYPTSPYTDLFLKYWRSGSQFPARAHISSASFLSSSSFKLSHFTKIWVVGRESACKPPQLKKREKKARENSHYRVEPVRCADGPAANTIGRNPWEPKSHRSWTGKTHKEALEVWWADNRLCSPLTLLDSVDMEIKWSAADIQ